jgi:hypothetical protein
LSRSLDLLNSASDLDKPLNAGVGSTGQAGLQGRGIEVKRTMAPKIERSFHSACADLNPQNRFYVYPGTERFPLDNKTDAISVVELAKTLQSVK